jgi:small conductance mechanosensitive channel
VEELTNVDISGLGNQAWGLIMEYGPKILLAIITLIIGLWIIKKLAKLVGKAMNKGKTDDTLTPFVVNLVNWTLRILLFLSVGSMIGIETTSFIAIFSAATLAIGFALQGSLSNFAGGVILLIFKPYKVGDLVEVQGQMGTVKAIQLFNTILVNFQNQTIIIPNGTAAGNLMKNYTTEGILRVDLTAGVAYESDLKKTKEVLMKVLNDHPKVLKDPAPFVGLNEMADSSLNFVVRPYAKVEDYWDVYFQVNEQVKQALDDAKITIPFPQMDVHLDN